MLPRWRWLSRWPTAIVSVLGLAVAFLATTSGDALEEARPGLRRLVEQHSQRGELLANLTIVLATMVLVQVVLTGDSGARAVWG